MPGDCFTFAVFIRCQQDLFGVFHQLFELGDLSFFIWVDDIQGCEIVFDIDALFRPGELLYLFRNIGSALWQIANVADASLDDEVIAEVAANFARFSW